MPKNMECCYGTGYQSCNFVYNNNIIKYIYHKKALQVRWPKYHNLILIMSCHTFKYNTKYVLCYLQFSWLIPEICQNKDVFSLSGIYRLLLEGPASSESLPFSSCSSPNGRMSWPLSGVGILKMCTFCGFM